MTQVAAMIVTVPQLRKLKACEDQVTLFETTFGQQVEVSLDNCLKAAKAGIDLNWAANNLLTPPQFADYLAKRDLLYADYLAKHNQSWNDYVAKRAEAFYQATQIP